MTSSIEERLRDYGSRLDEAAAACRVPTPRVDVPRGRRRRTLLGLAVATASTAAIMTALVVGGSDPDRIATAPTDTATAPTDTVSSLLVATATTPGDGTAPDGTATAVGVGTGGWSDIADSPLTGREDTGAVWTGTEFLLWGGRVDNFLYQQGAAYDPSTDTWREITPNQWAGLGTATTWTGTQMVALFKNGGVAYDPASDSWSDLPSIGADQWFEDASWTGTGVLAIGGRADETSTAVVATATITPGEESWRPGSASTIPLTEDVQYAATPTGCVVWRPTPDRRGAEAWAYDVSTDTWSELPSLVLDSDRRIESSLVVPTTSGWTVVISTTPALTATEPAMTATVTATLDGTTWRTTDIPIAIDATQGVGIDGDAVVVFGSSNGTPMAVAIDADGALRDAWALDPQATTGQALAWNGSALFAWGGRLDERDVTAQGRLFTP